MELKIVMTLSVSILLLSGALTLAAAPKQPAYCEHQGYTYIQDNHTCLFNDGNSCDAIEFYNGTCGQEYVKDIPCREEGELVFEEFESCCEGLEAHLEPGVAGQPTCKTQKGIFGSIQDILLNIFSPLF